MLVPAFLHGRKMNVKRACKRAAKRLGEGESLATAIDGKWVDTRVVSGPMMLEPPVGGGEEEKFFLYCFPEAILEDHGSGSRLRAEQSPLFDELIDSDWGCLSLLPSPGGQGVIGAGALMGKFAPFAAYRVPTFLRRIEEMWPTWEEREMLFETSYLPEGGVPLNEVRLSTLANALAVYGAPTDALMKPKSLGALRTMIVTTLATGGKEAQWARTAGTS